MKKQINLTNKDKLEILNNLNKFYDEQDGLYTMSGTIFATFGFMGPLICAVVAILHDIVALKGVLLGVGVSAFIVAFTAISTRLSFRKLVTKKISYGQYKKLEKSGEIKTNRHFK